ncbi:MAG: 50S ribosomal protein L16 [Candidatus Aenigmarchaeota archaeon]|nr:50S ribosomal protein L16 [Candidatus Aenigmarchaeota archaeon]
MALRPGRTVRKLERPYTRISKKKPRKSYIVGVPYSRIHIFEMGNRNKEFDTNVWLVAEKSVQIRDNALESARVVSNKFLERELGSDNYFMKVLVFPHHVLREHALATGAGADRFSSGMRHSFGKPSGRAVQIRKGQEIFVLKVDKKDIAVARKALKRADSKLSTTCRIKVE